MLLWASHLISPLCSWDAKKNHLPTLSKTARCFFTSPVHTRFSRSHPRSYHTILWCSFGYGTIVGTHARPHQTWVSPDPHAYQGLNLGIVLVIDARRLIILQHLSTQQKVDCMLHLLVPGDPPSFYPSLEGGSPPGLFLRSNGIQKVSPKIQLFGTFSTHKLFLTYLIYLGPFGFFSTLA